ncbi:MULTISPECIES: cupredoxin family copper-binding protein [unclassified Rhodococcus (in: high G+C Gram-positive bacteria)]|uniref:cupredoxin domain-containing protein n=1 Tax=unclassified Rhodococcus (in: high G+C Gram-positive bacteria) TaxID=192944 RepID=UPI0033981CE3
MKTSRAFSGCIASAFVLASLIGCSSPEPEQAQAPVANQVTVKNRTYTPASITVDVGDTVTWVFDDGGMTHDVVADDKSFRSPLMTSNTFTHTFTEPGTYTYHCTPHPDMMGTVLVQG